jgi:hypothetical protein
LVGYISLNLEGWVRLGFGLLVPVRAVEELDAVSDQSPGLSSLAVLLIALLNHATLDRHLAALGPVFVKYFSCSTEALDIEPIGVVPAFGDRDGCPRGSRVTFTKFWLTPEPTGNDDAVHSSPPFIWPSQGLEF